MGEQRTSNIHLKDRDEASYVEMRVTRDKQLNVPKLIVPSIQVNIDGARLPTAKPGDKHAHLKMPLNATPLYLNPQK
jgi:hypothetical protein